MVNNAMNNSGTLADNKIIFVTISMRGGGTERVISLLADNWVSQGKRVDIMMIGDTAIEYELDERVNVYSVSEATGGSIMGRVNRITQMRKIFKTNKNAVIIAMGTVAAMFASVALTGLNRRFILSERNDPNRLNHRPIKSYEKAIRDIFYKKADRIVFQTHMAEECFKDSLRKKGTIILNPLNIEHNETTEGSREQTIITAGRLTQQKNHKLLIDAFEEFSQSHEDYKLLIFGKGELENEIQQYIEQKGLTGKALMKGFSDNIHHEFRTGGIYVSSSDWEGISNSLAEAMACGIPVVATNCPMGGCAMLIQNEENGILIEPGDRAALVKALEKLSTDSEYYAGISEAGKRITQKLDIQKIAEEWEALF